MRSALTALVLLLSPVIGESIGVGAVGIEAQTPSRPEIVSLDFEGHGSVSEQALRGAIVTRETSCKSRVLLPLCWLGAGDALDRAYLNPRIFEDDYLRLNLFYRQLGFREARIDTTVVRTEDNRAEITFTIREGEPYRIGSLAIFGMEEVEDSSLAADLPVSVGDRLDQRVLEAARDTLGERLRDQGYAHADVLRNVFIPAESREAEVEFDVYTGPRARFGPIEIVRGAGDGELSETVIRRMLPFGEGTVYSQELLFEAQRNLYSLQILSHAAIVQQLDHEPDSIVPLRVQVNEGYGHRVRAGAGWDTAECFRAESQWSSFNFFGGARRLGLRARVSNILTHALEESVCAAAGTEAYGDPNWVVSADFTQPWIFSPRNSFSAAVFAERQSLQDVFVREALGFNLSLTRSLGRSTPLTLSYRPQLARLNAAEIFFCTSVLVCNPLDIDLLQASNWLSPVGLSLFRDRTNRALAPTGGYTFLADLELAAPWTGSDWVYERALTEATGFFGLRENLVLAGRLRAGWLNPGAFKGLTIAAEGGDRAVGHPQKRFYAGGSNSVRGYPQNQLGPQVASVQLEDLLFPSEEGGEAVCLPEEVVDLTCDASALHDDAFFERPTGGTRIVEGSLELRFPLTRSLLSGAAFVDFGQVWEEAGRFTFDRLVFSPGIGVRYATPVGPVRVDVGYRGRETFRRPIVTSQLRPFDPDRDDPDDRLAGPGGETLDWVRVEDLAPLGPLVSFEEGGGSLWSRLQLHVSIGHAF